MNFYYYFRTSQKQYLFYKAKQICHIQTQNIYEKIILALIIAETKKKSCIILLSHNHIMQHSNILRLKNNFFLEFYWNIFGSVFMNSFHFYEIRTYNILSLSIESYILATTLTDVIVRNNSKYLVIYIWCIHFLRLTMNDVNSWVYFINW